MYSLDTSESFIDEETEAQEGKAICPGSYLDINGRAGLGIFMF